MVQGVLNCGYELRCAMLAIAGTAACGDPAMSMPHHDAAIEGVLDSTGMLDGGMDGGILDGPTSFVPIHVLPATLLPGAPDLVLSASPSTIDTSMLTIDGATSPYFVRQGGYAVLLAGAFAVQGPVVIKGSAPLIVAANGRVTVTANIALGAAHAVPGPGATSTGAGGAGTTMLGFEVRASSGGGGGSYGTPGSQGSTYNATIIPAGHGGAVYGMSSGDPLIGGSPGGNGGFSIGAVGLGGGGGGALQISSAISIRIEASVNAGGGGGGGGLGGSTGGGGGGDGGEILLESPSITISGTLAANGGGGGGGGSGDAGPPGTNGQDGGASRAMGGTGGIPQGCNGGAGSIGPSGGEAPDPCINSKGGGGGGGAVWIWLRYRTATPPDLTSANITPPASMDPALP